MKKGKILVVYYSKTGNNRKSARAMAKEFSADIMEAKGDSRRLSGYSRALFCFPVWAFSPCGPIKDFIKNASLKGIKAGAVTICRGHPWRSDRTMKRLIEKSGGEFLGFAMVKQSDDLDSDVREAVEKAKRILETE
jgi:flavodoxin